MGCAHYLEDRPESDGAFTVDASRITFGKAIDEVGPRARAWGMKRVALYTDRHVARHAFFARAEASLRDAGIDVATYAACEVEPTNRSFDEARAFAADAKPDGFVSVGGGSVIDTCKAADLYSTHPAPLLAYVKRADRM